jgi:hypothetical protein
LSWPNRGSNQRAIALDASTPTSTPPMQLIRWDDCLCFQYDISVIVLVWWFIINNPLK